MPKIHAERGSGNIFEDVGFGKAEARALLAKSELVIAIRSMIEAAGWTQAEASKGIGMTQPSSSRMMRGDFNEISLCTCQLLSAIDATNTSPKSTADSGRRDTAITAPSSSSPGIRKNEAKSNGALFLRLTVYSRSF